MADPGEGPLFLDQTKGRKVKKKFLTPPPPPPPYPRRSGMIARWDFYFIKVLLASSEERVFFPPGKLNIKIA